MMVSASVQGVISRTLLDEPGVRVVRTDYADGLRQERHAHEFSGVSLVLTGAVRERVGSREHTAETLSAVVKHAGVEHACQFMGGTRMMCIALDHRVLDDMSEAAEAIPGPWRWIQHPRMAARILRIHRLAGAGRFAGRPDELLIELTAALSDMDIPRQGRPPAWLLGAEESLRAHPGRPRIRAIAEDAGVHPVHLARAFRSYFGRTPTEYAAWLRLRRASALLATDARSASVVALESGFSDHSHLCREFRAHLGVPPTEFRRVAKALS